MTDFSDLPLMVGTLRGVRSFRVTPDGTLTGVVYKREWAADDNEAVCPGLAAAVRSFSRAIEEMGQTMTELAAVMAWSSAQHAASIRGQVNLLKKPKPAPKKPAPAVHREPHHIAALDCTCGYYAYFDGLDNPHHREGQAVGIIEGYGRLTVGSRGFRAERARIVALVRPTPETRTAYPNARAFDTITAALATYPVAPPTRPEPAAAPSLKGDS